MIKESCWLPELVYFSDYDGDFKKYQDYLYDIFKNDFIITFPKFRGKPVKIRKYPIEYGKEEAFFHVTYQDYLKNKDRVPDFRRCERIKWVRAFIEKYTFCTKFQCLNCSGTKVWDEPYKNKIRTHILLEDERYMIVVENRNSYYLLITAFYLEYDQALRKKLRHYEQYRNK